MQLSSLFIPPEGSEGLGLVRRGGSPALPEVEFDRGMFLLGKQLLYFERYGKLYLSDVSLLSDRDFFESLLRS